jgi:hypothetical protein
MTTISVTNYRGLSSAEVRLADTVTLVAGQNAAGKTSFCQAAGAAMSGRTIPVDGLSKSQLSMLVRSGTASGDIVVDNTIGKIYLSFPGGVRATEGTPVEISETAAGIDSILDHKKTDRAAIVSQIIKALPSSDDFAASIKAMIPEAEILSIKRAIDSLGWDAAHDAAKQAGAKLKGKWEQITREAFGTSKAASWVPGAWTSDLSTAEEKQLRDILDSERAWLDASKADAAVSAELVARLEAEASGLPDIERLQKEASDELQSLHLAGVDLRKVLSGLPPAERVAALVCPHCNGPLEIAGASVRIPVVVSDSEIAARREAILACQAQLDTVVARYRACNTTVGDLRAKRSAADKAAAELAAIRAKGPSSGQGSHGAVADCQARVSTAEARLAAFVAARDARVVATQVEANQAAIDALAPGGLRAKYLSARLEYFNSRLRGVCDSAGWRTVALGRDMGVAYGGTPWMLASQSEQYRCRAALQIAVAQIDGSTVVVLDGADVLDAAGRKGLMVALAKCGRQAIVGMTIDSREKLPKLDAIGGSVVWIQEGVVDAA